MAVPDTTKPGTEIVNSSASYERKSFFLNTQLLTVYIRIKLQLDLQANKFPIVVKGPFFPQV
jgi:hypothetical protein